MDEAEQRLNFVRKVQKLVAKGHDVEKAIKTVEGEYKIPDAPTYQRWAELVSSVDEEYGKGSPGFGSRFASLFSSGLFFMVVGAFMLIWAEIQHGSTHSTFVFVYVVLGVAIILYGTGTQAVGSFDGVSIGDWKVQGSLAGGAGVLAILIGWTIVAKYSEMRNAFEQQRSYIRVIVGAQHNDFSGAIDLTRYFLVAKRGHISLPVTQEGARYVIYLPFYSDKRPCMVPIETELHGKSDRSKISGKFVIVDEERQSEKKCQYQVNDLGTRFVANARKVLSSGVDFDEFEATLNFAVIPVSSNLSEDFG